MDGECYGFLPSEPLHSHSALAVKATSVCHKMAKWLGRGAHVNFQSS